MKAIAPLLERKFSVVVNNDKKSHGPEIPEITGGSQLDLYKKDTHKLLANLSLEVSEGRILGVAVVTIGADLEADASGFTSACADNLASTLGGLDILRKRLLDECLTET